MSSNTYGGDIGSFIPWIVSTCVAGGKRVKGSIKLVLWSLPRILPEPLEQISEYGLRILPYDLWFVFNESCVVVIIVLCQHFLLFIGHDTCESNQTCPRSPQSKTDHLSRQTLGVLVHGYADDRLYTHVHRASPRYIYEGSNPMA